MFARDKFRVEAKLSLKLTRDDLWVIFNSTNSIQSRSLAWQQRHYSWQSSSVITLGIAAALITVGKAAAAA
jgi:hypothetical protein